jgi:hypothetical protein
LTTLSADIDNAVTSFTVASAPDIPFAKTYVIQIDNEQMLVITVSAETNTLTVTRGYNGTAAAARAGQTEVRLNYGSRADYVNLTLEHDLSPQPVGCAMLFIYYLRDQLGFDIDEIIAAAPGIENASALLRGVYRNLTGDDSDPFPLFKQLLDNAYPPNQRIPVLGDPGYIPDPKDPASPWPIGRVSFGLDKSTFGKDEIDGALQLSTAAGYPRGCPGRC